MTICYLRGQLKTRPATLAMDTPILVGFGYAAVLRDGEEIWRETPEHDAGIDPATESIVTNAWRVADAESAAAIDSEHDWRIVLLGPLCGLEYQRTADGRWLLAQIGRGFA